jgi:DNA-directed RNA polymerase subunit beta'
MDIENQNIKSEKVAFKGKEISYGRYIFNKCLPEDYPLIDTEITKAKLNKIINDIVLRYPSSVVMNTLDKIKNVGFSYSTSSGFTLTLEDLYDQELLDYVDEVYSGDYYTDLEKMESDEFLKSKLKNMPFSIFIESGARGSWDQARQMVFSRGYIADANNNVRPEPIKSGLVKGLTPKEFFDSCYGSRKGLLDTALSTGEAGYLTRQLIYSTADIELGDEVDCGTQDTLTYTINNDVDLNGVRWRYYITEDGKKKLIKSNTPRSELMGKTIQLRSPIFCKSKKICKTCYGNLRNILHSDQIGIIATQAIGEKATQLVLRTFHTSGAASSTKTDSKSSKNDDIISGMTIVKKLFHNPNSIKNIDEPEELVELVRTVFGKYGKILNVHFEVIVSSMMWDGNRRWRLIKNRNDIKPEYVSILQSPSRSSWLIGCAFSNLKRKLIEGVIYEDEDESSSLTDLFRY